MCFNAQNRRSDRREIRLNKELSSVGQMAPFSVVMPVYNAEAYIHESLESLRRQTVQPAEVIVVDDASTDKTPDILEKYEWDILKVVRQDKNIGPAEANNCGIEMAGQEYIAKMDADDISLPLRFERQWEYLRHNRQVAVIGTSAMDIDERGVPLDNIRSRINTSFRPSLIYKGNYLTHGTTVYSRKMWERCGGYRKADEPAADYALFLKMSQYGMIENIMEVHYLYRVHDMQISSVKQEKQERKAYELRHKAVADQIKKKLTACADELTEPLWIYGAGETGKLVADRLSAMGLDVAGFFDKSFDCDANGIPVLHLSQLDSENEGSVIIGSFGHQDAMEAYIRYRCPLLKVITVF